MEDIGVRLGGHWRYWPHRLNGCLLLRQHFRLIETGFSTTCSSIQLHQVFSSRGHKARPQARSWDVFSSFVWLVCIGLCCLCHNINQFPILVFFVKYSTVGFFLYSVGIRIARIPNKLLYCSLNRVYWLLHCLRYCIWHWSVSVNVRRKYYKVLKKCSRRLP